MMFELEIDSCNQLINGADPFNTCVKIQGKMRICNGIGLTSSGENLCPSDHLLCPSSLGQTSASSSGACVDKEGKYRDKKCAKKQAAGKCSKKKMKKKGLSKGRNVGKIEGVFGGGTMFKLASAVAKHMK